MNCTCQNDQKNPGEVFLNRLCLVHGDNANSERALCAIVKVEGRKEFIITVGDKEVFRIAEKEFTCMGVTLGDSSDTYNCINEWLEANPLKRRMI